MRVAVTGGAGFIGSHLVHRLVADPAIRCTVIDNFSRGTRANLAHHGSKAHLLELDIRDDVRLSSAMRGQDLVYHLAAQSNVTSASEDPDYCLSTNVDGTANVLNAARKAGVQRVIFASSREVYGEVQELPVPETAPVQPKNLYGISKAKGEELCFDAARAGLQIVLFRIANVYGPRDEGRVIPLFIEKALRGDPITLFGGTQILDFIWVGYVVDALLSAACTSCTGTPLNLGSGQGTQLTELARRVLQMTGSRSQIQFARPRSQEVTRFVADVRKAATALGLAAITDSLNHLPALIAELDRSGRHAATALELEATK